MKSYIRWRVDIAPKPKVRHVHKFKRHWNIDTRMMGEYVYSVNGICHYGTLVQCYRKWKQLGEGKIARLTMNGETVNLGK